MKKQTKAPVFNQYETVSPATKLLEKRRKMYEIHEQFEAKKDDFKSQEGDFKTAEDDLKTKDKDLQNKLTAFCQMLQENESKRRKAEEKFRQDEKAYAQKEEAIKSLQREIEELKRSQKKYQVRATYLRKYEEFLERVRSTYSEEYPEMADILNRYNTLKKSNDDRIRERQTMEGSHEELKRTALAEEKRYSQQILTLSNEIKELSKRIEDRIKEKNEVQAEVEHSNEEFSKKNLTLGKIFLAIDNISHRCNENSYRLKYEFDLHSSNPDRPRPKKPDNEGTLKAEEELTYEQRSKQAANKLKNIITHMRDFKELIDRYTAATKHSKN